jgi:Tfp pilus assembly ATPase PilU
MLSNARQGMRILDSELLRLVNENAVAFEEALAMANDKEAFREASVRTPAALKARETD